MTQTGVLSLRCTSCGRLFLSLPQQSEALMKCPQCSHRVVIEAFEDGASTMPGPISRALKRRSPLPPTLEKPPADEAWLHLGVHRSHGLELPESLRDSLVALPLQGSADGSLACLAAAPPSNPTGWHLARETA